MCRWLAYSGSPIALDTFLLEPEHSLIDQSLHARMGVETTNGDGFGVGWYGEDPEPTLYRSISPAWNDRNLRELAAHVRSGLFLAHIRASTGTAVQQTNCHPFRHGCWLWMHNGLIREFSTIKRELVMAVDPGLFAAIEGSTDSELMFYLALSLGLADDPITAVERMAGMVEEAAERHGIENPLQMSLATTNGEQLWVFRYSTEQRSRSLFYSTHVRTLRELYPDDPRLEAASDETRLIVSEPLSDLAGVWNEIPESSCGIVQAGQDELRPFRPRR
ncbi:MAG: class II glutamine amidotransferase [Gammaproteobacteria bacterium]|nr:MAG: class II glutamine amidotransferase [Gammaproteobacteria bacterium]